MCFYLASLCRHLLVLHLSLLQDGVHHIEVHGRHMDVHINVNGHLFRTLRAPEIDLQMTPKPNTWACWDTRIWNLNTAFQPFIWLTGISWNTFYWEANMLWQRASKYRQYFMFQEDSICISEKAFSELSESNLAVSEDSIIRCECLCVREGSKVHWCSPPGP